MFTGIIEDIGKIVEVKDTDDFRSVRVAASKVLDDMRPGASIATNGICVTARTVDDSSFTAELSRETLSCTTLGNIFVGAFVNLERSMSANSRFGGHIVQGHVDGIGQILSFDRTADNWILEIGYDSKAPSRIVWKGSIAIDGISLTVAAIEKDSFSIAIIPQTLENTNLLYAEPGLKVNLEFDILAKYLETLAEPYLKQLRQSFPDLLPFSK